MILGAAVVFLLFLSFMPASFKPLVFVAAQSRYMVVFIPFLAIGAGGMISGLLSSLMAQQALRRLCLLALTVAIAINLWLPNYRYGSFSKGPPVGKALTQLIERASEYGISTVILPWDDWQAKVTEPFYDRKIEIVLAERGTSQSAGEFGEIDPVLNQHPRAAVFVPTSMAQDEHVQRLSCDSRYQRIPLMVPGSSVSSWLSTIKGRRGDTLAAYLFVRKVQN
jgi:hypothetical protein